MAAVRPPLSWLLQARAPRARSSIATGRRFFLGSELSCEEAQCLAVTAAPSRAVSLRVTGLHGA